MKKVLVFLLVMLVLLFTGCNRNGSGTNSGVTNGFPAETTPNVQANPTENERGTSGGTSLEALFTEIQNDPVAAYRKYQGKEIEIWGQVGALYSFQGKRCLAVVETFNPAKAFVDEFGLDGYADIYWDIDGLTPEQISSLRVGENIHLRGTIDVYALGLSSVKLTDCRILG